MNNNRNFRDKNRKKKSENIAHRKMRKNDDHATSSDYTKHILSSVGNQAFQKVASGGLVQAKLRSAAASNPFEKQADQVADQVVGKSTSGSKPPSISKVQPQGKSGGNLSGETETGLKNIKGKGNGLSRDLRNYFEPRFGKDLGNVRIHTGKTADKLATDLNARAFTHGKDIVFKEGEFQPGTGKGKKLIAHELTHTVQQEGGVNPQGAPVIQAKELDEVPEKSRRRMKVITTNINIPVDLISLFKPAGCNLQFENSDVTPLITWGVRFAGVPPELQEGLRLIAGLFIDSGMRPNTSITWTARFADENFAEQSFFKSLPEYIQDIFNSYGVFRFTSIDKGDGEGGSTEKIIIQTLCTINKKKEKPTAEETENYKAVFDENFSILSGSAAGKGFKDFTGDEKAMLYKAVATLPESVHKKISGIKWCRQDKDPDPAYSKVAGMYIMEKHSIVLYDAVFQDHKTLVGSINTGFRSDTELTIFHEIGHAVDWADFREAEEKEKRAQDELEKAIASEKAVFKEHIAINQNITKAKKEHMKCKDEYEKLLLEREKKVDKHNSYKTKKLTGKDKEVVNKLKEEIPKLDQKISEAKKKVDEAKKQLDAANAKLDDIFKKSGEEVKNVNEKKAALAKAKEERANITTPSGSKQKLNGNNWERVNGAEKTKFRAAAIKDGAKEGKDGDIEGAITPYGGKNWSEYYCEAFSLFFSDAQRLQSLRPNIYKYFNDTFGRR